MEPIVGIDLGTTNSEIALVRDSQPFVFEDNGDPILPSFVGLSEDGRLLVGAAAKNQWVLAPERTIKSIKRKMGQDVKVKLGDQEYRPQEISAMILKALRDRAAAQLGVPVNKAVITVPAYFNDAQRQATREAGELAGLEVVRILNEPTAASLTYDPSQRELRRLLVYDLGGGTFDVSIVQAQEGVVEVLASHGDTQLGGDDFDDLLLNLVCDRFQQEHGVDLRANLVARSRVLRAVEAAKYGPQGKRSYGGPRAGMYGARESPQDYVRRANHETVVVGLFEDVEGIDQIDEIFAVDGLDALCVGPNDLAFSMGYPAQPWHPEVQKVVDRVIEASKRSGKATGLPAADLDQARAHVARGCRIISVGVGAILMNGARALQAGLTTTA